MAKTPKCKICGEIINKKEISSFIKKQGRYIHVECEGLKLSPNENAEEKALKSPVCSFCKEDVLEVDLVKRGSLKVHRECLDRYHVEGQADVKTVLRTCPECGTKIDPLSTEAIDVQNATYHNSCYQKKIREKENREKLTDYISLKYNIGFPTGLMLKQISLYKKERNYSYKAMLATLKYIFEIEKIPLVAGTGIGMIPFFYDKAKRYHKEISTVSRAARNIKINNEIVKITSIEENKTRRKKYDLSSF